MPKKDRQATRMTPGFTGPMKGEPQQGTLFDKRALDRLPGNQAQTDQRIGPRGYSVERSRQFQGLLTENYGTGLTKVGVGYRKAHNDEERQRPDYSEMHDTVPAMPPESHPFSPTLSDMRYGRNMRRAKSKVIDTLARSSIEPEHLQGLPEISMKGRDSRFAGTYHSGPNFEHISLNQTQEGIGGTPDRTKQPEQRGATSHDNEITLVHEIGHKVSHQNETWHSRYSDETEKAAEEGFADNFAMTHWRADPRHQGWEGDFEPRQHTYGGIGHHYASYPEYRRNLGSENKSPGSRVYVTAAVESRDRPMLGHGTGVFDDAIPEKIKQGFSSSWETDQHQIEGTEAEKAWYGRRRQDTNRDVFHSAQRPSIAARWQVRQQSLGRQFSEPETQRPRPRSKRETQRPGPP